MEDPNALVERINKADRRQRRVTYLLQAFGGALLTLIALANIFALLQLHTIINEHYQRTAQIDQQFSNQFGQIEAALKAQDAYFACRIDLTDISASSSPSALQTCIAPFGNTTPTGTSDKTTSAQSSEAPASTSGLAVSREPSTTQSAPTTTATSPAPSLTPAPVTTSPQPIATAPLQATTQLLQSTASNTAMLVKTVIVI
jgi:cytoskeletal protein RodZ